MREAFTYMFKDPRYNDKAIAYFVICTLSLALMGAPELASINTLLADGPKVTTTTSPLFTILPVIGMVFNMILCGYYYTCVQALTRQNQNYILPFINIPSSFIKGLKLFIAVFLFLIVTGIACALFTFAGQLGVVICYTLFLLLFSICANAFLWLFSNEGKISTFLAWNKAFKLISANSKTYFTNLIILGLITLAGALASTLFLFLFNFLVSNIYVAWILTSIEGAIIASYTAFVSMFLIAKSIKPETVV